MRPVPEELTIRQLAPVDEVALGQLMYLAYRGGVDDHGETPDWHVREARRTIAGKFGPVLWDASAVACARQELLGACIVTHDRTHLLLAFALVLPEWQGRGVGSALIACSAQALLGSGYRAWTLAVTDGNPACRLYARMGFEVHESLRGT